VLVGGLGFIIQLAVLAVLLTLAHWSWPAATIVAVECAIVHNFAWHERWTWADRGRPSHKPRRHQFLRFNVATGLTSIIGNVVVMAILVGGLHVPAIPANVIAVGVMSAANYLLADRWVFRHSILPHRHAAAVLALLATAAQASAAPTADTLGAWTKYVATAERTLQEHAMAPVARTTGIRADGDTIDVGSGTISHWRGAVFLPGLTLDRLLHGLQHPGTPPPQEDVVASRVMSRGPDCLRVYIRLVRHAIVTVSYDTEHEMTFTRLTPALATARSVATRIDEVGGGDHGFLWRLNSYWRYEQVGAGVLVSLESLTLSRDVPMLIKPIAGRIVPRIARESMVRTLEALRRQFAG
jgi:putative flippase GtrA